MRRVRVLCVAGVGGGKATCFYLIVAIGMEEEEEAMSILVVIGARIFQDFLLCQRRHD